MEEFKTLRAELRRHACNTCQIFTAPSEACDVLEWVARVNDKRCGLHGFSHDSRCPRAQGEQNIDRHLDEFSRQPRYPIVSAIGESLLDNEVLPLDVA